MGKITEMATDLLENQTEYVLPKDFKSLEDINILTDDGSEVPKYRVILRLEDKPRASIRDGIKIKYERNY